MFFPFSKVVGFLIEPVSVIAILAGLAVVALMFNRRKTGFALAFIAFLVAAVAGWTTAGTIALAVLEDRFPRPARMPDNVTGIIVLGGGFEAGVSRARGQAELRDSGDRYVEAAMLALAYPQAKVAVTGGSGALAGDQPAEAGLAPGFFARFGIAPERLILEDRSRNTHENAEFLRALIAPKTDETWLLVTSAFHMPRSVGLFRKAGLAATPWPVDYRTSGVPRMRPVGGSPIGNMVETSIAVREWVGLAAYFATGRIDDPFPSP